MAIIPEEAEDGAENSSVKDGQFAGVGNEWQRKVTCPGSGGVRRHSFGGDVAEYDEDEADEPDETCGEAIHTVGEIDGVACGGDVEDCDDDEDGVCERQAVLIEREPELSAVGDISEVGIEE